MTIYKVRLYKSKNEISFEKFMQNEVFVAVNKSQRRDGKITSLQLFKSNNTGHTNEYFWLVEGALNGGAANQALDMIAAFGGKVTPMNDYVECGNWKAEK